MSCSQLSSGDYCEELGCKITTSQINTWKQAELNPGGVESKYVEMWKRNKGKKHTRPPVFGDLRNQTIINCIFRGEELRREQCATCGGNIQVKVFSCEIHEECTRGKKIGSVKCCRMCDDAEDKEIDCLRWAYGVTTVPSRKNELLPRTLNSLKAAGFDSPRLFVDGQVDQGEYDHFGLEITLRYPAIRIAGNLVLALCELFFRDAHADRYAIFQDDFVTYTNIKEYLEKSEYPDKGYLNLYTFPENEIFCKDKNSWHPSNQRGRGAVALVFSNDAVTTLLSSKHLLDRAKTTGMEIARSYKVIDGTIVECMTKAGWKEYVHSPSLVQHIGDVSTLNHPIQERATSFKGEKFDAMDLLK